MLDGDRTRHTCLRTEAAEYGGRFSPNGEYLGYVSERSGREEVYVSTFP